MVVLWLALSILSVVAMPVLLLLFLPVAYYFTGTTHRVCVKCGTKVAGFFGEVKAPKLKVASTTIARPR